MIGSFETNLPNSYSSFKKLANELFPIVFDTRHISYSIRDTVPREKSWNDRGLDTIFDYFKNGIGRTLASNAPAIEIEEKEDSVGKFHHAGWDSFCAGYIFIRLAHLNIYQKYPISKQFVSSEHIAALSHLKNKVNIIRGSVSHINLDGEDPSSTRPPYLVIESLKNKPVCIPQVASLLSTFGYTEVRKIPYQKKIALVAVDNYGNARRILRDFKNMSTEYDVQRYNALKHSPFARFFFVGGLTVSSVLILWITHAVIKR
ncbi:pre-piRNA 3'-exonuclease trimmer-like isoform X2 [Anthonomus grandis grandis]|nr:pre-piRNA 3'-exonuclease trimmer-like isoform X2 [Anthonomus grandis grandis]